MGVLYFTIAIFIWFQSTSFGLSHHPQDSFFMGLNRLSYARDSLASKHYAVSDCLGASIVVTD